MALLSKSGSAVSVQTRETLKTLVRNLEGLEAISGDPQALKEDCIRPQIQRSLRQT